MNENMDWSARKNHITKWLFDHGIYRSKFTVMIDERLPQTSGMYQIIVRFKNEEDRLLFEVGYPKPDNRKINSRYD